MADILYRLEKGSPLTNQEMDDNLRELDENRVKTSLLGATNGDGIPVMENGVIKEENLPPIPSGPPVGSVAWWPLRSSVPTGQIPADGQTVSRATFPDIAAMVVAGTVPVVTEAEWQANPLKRGAYTLGDGSSTIRVPDYNGKSAGAYAALVMRGDGARAAGTNGLIQADTLGPIRYRVSNFAQATSLLINGVNHAVMPSGNLSGSTFTEITQTSNGTTWITNTAEETRMSNVSGVWTIHAFGAVTNPGSVDAAQLASDYAVLNASFQTVRGQAFGVGQSMQNVAGSRAIGVAYTNTTGRPIVVYISGDTNTSAGGNLGITIGGLFVTRSIWASQGIALAVTAVVPPGIAYVANASGIALSQWQEYR